jgi:DNA repair protein RadC
VVGTELAKKAKKSGADEVLLVDTEELVEDSLAGLEPVDMVPNQRSYSLDDFEEPVGLDEVYGGYSRFLVRTALLRSKKFNMRSAPKITRPEDAMELVTHLVNADQEHIVLLCFNSQMRLVAIHETSVGTSSQAISTARDLVKVPLLVAATGVIMCHNHPSGSSEFSREDIEMTRTSQKSFDCVGVNLLDHILVARPMLSYVNMYGSLDS